MTDLKNSFSKQNTWHLVNFTEKKDYKKSII